MVVRNEELNLETERIIREREEARKKEEEDRRKEEEEKQYRFECAGRRINFLAEKSKTKKLRDEEREEVMYLEELQIKYLEWKTGRDQENEQRERERKLEMLEEEEEELLRKALEISE